MSNAVSTTWPSGSTNAGWPQEPTGMLMPGRIQGWPAGTQRAANPATTLLSQAVAWWDVEQYREGDRFLRNRGTGGELLDLRLGSSIVANSNDPQYLAPDSTGYVYFSGASNNCLQVPDENALDVTDLDVRVRCSLDSLTDYLSFASKDQVGDGQRSWVFSNFSSNRPRLRWYPDGLFNNRIELTGDAAFGVQADQTAWFRVTLDVDNGAGKYEVRFYTAADSVAMPTTWTQVGSTITGGSTTAISAGTAVLSVGSSPGINLSASGRFYRFVQLSGIDGPTVLDIDCDAITSGSNTSFLSVGNQTVSVNRSTSGRKSVCVPSRHKGGRPVMLLGTDDYLEVQDSWQHGLLNFDQGQSFTVLAVVRSWATASAGMTILSKYASSATPGWALWNGTSAFTRELTLRSPTVTAVSPAGSAGALAATAGVVTPATVTSFSNGVAGSVVSRSTVTPMVNSSTLRVGAGSSFFDGEFYAAAVFRRVLTAAEIKTLSDYFTGRIA